MRETLRGSNSLGEAKLDALRLHELEQAFAVCARFAIDFSQRGKVFALGLADVKNVDGSESVQRPLTFRGCVFTRFVGRYTLGASSSDHRGENKNAFFSPFNEAAKRVPCPKSGNVSSIGLLTCDQHNVAEAVGVKLRHCSEVCGEDFTVTGLQCCNEEIHGLFGSCVDFFSFHVSSVSGLFLSSLERQREETRRNGERDRTEAGGGWQGVSESAVSAKRGRG